ncbi:hypothetical protein V5O48_017217 [Marasmius crinis-equi]|uniref:Glycosyl hydrolase family 92 domain-containing protein n=1 Tax=Marasmius crinis-equi TaxID=585013 RepID=A0ABR3EPL4_9AGAR
MASYAAFYLAGLYPLPATRQFLLSSPFFREITWFNPVFDSTTTVRSVGFTGEGGDVFVKHVTINGTPSTTRCFLEWDVFLNPNGTVIEIELGGDDSLGCSIGGVGGAGGDGDGLPPSLSTGGCDSG